jgi:hypothetical protein
MTLAVAALIGSPAGFAEDTHWVGTWSAAMQSPLFGAPQSFSGQTLRQIVHITFGGSVVRVRFSNAPGSQPLVIGGRVWGNGA